METWWWYAVVVLFVICMLIGLVYYDEVQVKPAQKPDNGEPPLLLRVGLVLCLILIAVAFGVALASSDGGFVYFPFR